MQTQWSKTPPQSHSGKRFMLIFFLSCNLYIWPLESHLVHIWYILFCWFPISVCWFYILRKTTVFLLTEFLLCAKLDHLFFWISHTAHTFQIFILLISHFVQNMFISFIILFHLAHNLYPSFECFFFNHNLYFSFCWFFYKDFFLSIFLFCLCTHFYIGRVTFCRDCYLSSVISEFPSRERQTSTISRWKSSLFING